MNKRKERLRKIREAQRELESCLLTMRDHYKVPWTEKGFQALYYLIAKAKETPTRRGR